MLVLNAAWLVQKNIQNNQKDFESAYFSKTYLIAALGQAGSLSGIDRGSRDFFALLAATIYQGKFRVNKMRTGGKKIGNEFLSPARSSGPLLVKHLGRASVEPKRTPQRAAPRRQVPPLATIRVSS